MCRLLFEATMVDSNSPPLSSYIMDEDTLKRKQKEKLKKLMATGGNPRPARSLLFLTLRNPFRKACLSIVEWKYPDTYFCWNYPHFFLIQYIIGVFLFCFQYDIILFIIFVCKIPINYPQTFWNHNPTCHLCQLRSSCSILAHAWGRQQQYQQQLGMLHFLCPWLCLKRIFLKLTCIHVTHILLLW